MRSFFVTLAVFAAMLGVAPHIAAGKPKPHCSKPTADLVVITCAHGSIKVVRAVIGEQLHVLTFVRARGVWFFFSDVLAKNLPGGGPPA